MFMLLLEFITFWMQSFFDYVSIFLPDLKILKQYLGQLLSPEVFILFSEDYSRSECYLYFYLDNITQDSPVVQTLYINLVALTIFTKIVEKTQE